MGLHRKIPPLSATFRRSHTENSDTGYVKAVIINTSDIIGGAALAGYAVAEALNQHTDVQTAILCGEKRSPLPHVASVLADRRAPLFKRLADIAGDAISNATVGQDYFLPTGRRILSHPFLQDAAVVNLHNIHGGYFPYPLIERLAERAAVVLSLQDMWYLTGHCAYSYECDGWYARECKPCPHLDWYPALPRDVAHSHYHRKRKAYSRAKPYLVTCSHWMVREIRRSPLLQEFPVVRIFNPVDTNVLRPMEQQAARAVLGLPQDKKIICFGASKINDERKGFRRFIETLPPSWQAWQDLHLLVMGRDTEGLLSRLPAWLPHTYLGNVSSDGHRAIAYNAADVFVFPTLADNLPNMLVETMSCGVPAVTFAVGGCGEIVVNDSTGYLAKAGDFADFFAGLELLLSNEARRKALGAACRHFAEANFSYRAVGEQYAAYYAKAVNRDPVL